ncbi:MAG: hypothetical protein NZ954_01920 [Thermofilaceae archaeon]|nr:hypothetical protein [Thermofilaceae archaeon]MDW8003429.1 hypothetical protein [Thermofilaceae archaeon]
MNVTLEYLAVGLLVLTVILAFNQVIDSLTPRLESVRGEQLFTVAERVLDKIVLTPGYPEDWGTNISVNPDTLKDFGLSLYGSRSPYVIDPDKVMRLANLTTLPNPLLLNASRLAEILALKKDYGFRLVMKPALQIGINVIEWYQAKNNLVYPSSFNINLTNYYDIGVPNANVTGMYIFVRVTPGNDRQGQVEEKAIFVKSCITNAVGVCKLDYRSSLTSYFNEPGSQPNKWYFPIFIVYANWQGFLSISGYTPTGSRSPSVQGYIIGNYIFVDREVEVIEIIKEGGKNSGAVHVKDDLLQVVPMYADLLNFTTVTWCRDANNNFRNDEPLCNAAGRVLPSARQWYLIGHIRYVEPLSSHVFVFAKYRGNPVAIIVNRIPSIDIAYGSKAARPANSVTLRRLAVLYNYPYVIELTIWRRVEGWP